MKLPILKVVDTNDFPKFIDYWSKFYNYSLESLYNTHILSSSYEEADIRELFKWKNGMNLSEAKNKSLESKILSKLDIIRRMQISESIDLNEFFVVFKNVSAVWKIFLLHIIKPTRYPIYDQHIHRAYSYVHGLEYENISASSLKDREKEDFYLNIYLPFIEKYRNLNLKKLDEALFEFGKFLRTEKYSEMLMQTSKN